MRSSSIERLIFVLAVGMTFAIANAPGALGCCNLPTQETTQYSSSENYPQYLYIGSNFEQTISDASGDSWNHNVGESFPFQGYDSCWYQGSPDPKQDEDDSTDTWLVYLGNQWLYDLNAWYISDAYDYETHYGSQTSCGLQYTQEMSIQTDCSYPLYEPYTTSNYVSAPGNTLFLTLGPGWEQSIREEFSTTSLVYGAQLPCCSHP